MINKCRLEACRAIYGEQPIDYYLGAVGAALREADEIAKSLGVERISLHSRLEQMAALVWQLKQKEKRNE